MLIILDLLGRRCRNARRISIIVTLQCVLTSTLFVSGPAFRIGEFLLFLQPVAVRIALVIVSACLDWPANS